MKVLLKLQSEIQHNCGLSVLQSYYPEVREKWLSDSEHSVIRDKVDAFMQARADFAENTFSIINNGGKVYDIVCYDLELFPLSAGYNKTNSDGDRY